jgi:5-methylcytosine-specific restriction endonuclease McrA
MALSKRAIGSGKWQKLRIQILDRDGWVCVVCNRPAHTVDHIIPRVRVVTCGHQITYKACVSRVTALKVVVFLIARRPPLSFLFVSPRKRR